MKLLKLLTIGARKGPIRTVVDLVGAISEGAAYLAQGASYSYMRARSGLMGPRLMQDPVFGANMERCKWEGFAAIAGDLILMVETELRRFGSAPPAIWQRIYREALAMQGSPEHRAETGWDDRIDEFERQLEAHLAQPVRDIKVLCAHGAGVLMDNTPVTEDIRGLDREMVVNNVTFRFIEHVGQLRQRADWRALMASITMASDANYLDQKDNG